MQNNHVLIEQLYSLPANIIVQIISFYPQIYKKGDDLLHLGKVGFIFAHSRHSHISTFNNFLIICVIN